MENSNAGAAQFVIPAEAGIQIFPCYSAPDARPEGIPLGLSWHDNFLFELSQRLQTSAIDFPTPFAYITPLPTTIAEGKLHGEAHRAL